MQSKRKANTFWIHVIRSLGRKGFTKKNKTSKLGCIESVHDQHWNLHYWPHPLAPAWAELYFQIDINEIDDCKRNKRALRPWIAHMSKQAKGQTHHLNKPDNWLKVKGWSWPILQKKFVFSFMKLHLSIFAPKSSTSSINSFPKTPKSKFDLTIRMSKSILCHLGKKLQNFPWNLMFKNFSMFDLAIK